MIRLLAMALDAFCLQDLFGLADGCHCLGKLYATDVCAVKGACAMQRNEMWTSDLPEQGWASVMLELLAGSDCCSRHSKERSRIDSGQELSPSQTPIFPFVLLEMGCDYCF